MKETDANYISEVKKEKASFRFYENKECEYYQCHEIKEGDFNCLFCFCPMYNAICLGTPRYLELNGQLIKDCAGCDYPHRAENYQTVMEYLMLILKD